MRKFIVTLQTSVQCSGDLKPWSATRLTKLSTYSAHASRTYSSCIEDDRNTRKHFCSRIFVHTQTSARYHNITRPGRGKWFAKEVDFEERRLTFSFPFSRRSTRHAGILASATLDFDWLEVRFVSHHLRLQWTEFEDFISTRAGDSSSRHPRQVNEKRPHYQSR